MSISPALIVVLGMHRSGTSAVTRGLRVLGVGLGNDFIETISGVNDKGFWEDREFNAINVALLELLGVTWYDMAPITMEALQQPEVAELETRAVAALSNKLAGSEILALKDPRTAILLPFWKQVFQRMALDVRYLIMLRHPNSVAESLGKRDRFDVPRSHMLWLTYALGSLLETQGARRIVVDYDILLDNPEAQLRRIAAGLGLPTWDETEYRLYAQSFLSPDMRHNRHSRYDLIPGKAVPKTLVEVYERLADAALDQIDLEAKPVLLCCVSAEAWLRDLTFLLHYADVQEARLRKLGMAGDAKQALEAAGAQLTALRETLTARETLIEQMLQSTSWRATWPLRWLASRMRGLSVKRRAVG